MKVFTAALCGALYMIAAISPASADNKRTPVLVELFTSEGCNDCPPANDVLTELSKRQTVPGAYIVALGEHVDYFNRPWVDRFSSTRFTARQQTYAQQFRLDEVYTPEMIVDGRTEFVGSDAGKAASAVAAAADRPHATVDVSIQPGVETGEVVAHVHASGVSGGQPYLFIAVTEDNLVSHVGSGENAGATLHHSGVVRTLQRLAEVNGGSVDDNLPVKIERGWNRSNLHIVAFVQDIADGAILGTGITDI